jgi:lysozyme
MKTSQNGLTLIEQSEGFRASAYQDVVGVWTIGYGHKIVAGDGFGPASTVTQEKAQAVLANDVQSVENVLNTLIPADCNQNQFDACIDFGLNLGVGALRQMLAHGWDQVAVQILRWNRAGGQVVEGLKRRRQAEVALFTGGTL